jgi:hypothetical protein
VRRSISAFSKFDATEGLARPATDLASGAWHKLNHKLLSLVALDIGH